MSKFGGRGHHSHASITGFSLDLSTTTSRTALTMRVFTRLLATAADSGVSRSLRPVPGALLPPIPLYRRLLRSHRKRLGVEERLLGDMYVKAEFRAHRHVENPVQIVRLVSCQNGSSTARCLKEIRGRTRKWRRLRLIR